MPTRSVRLQAARPRGGGAGPRRGPIGRIVAGSVTAGLGTALLLAVVVAPGAPEHVITGSALVSFAFGWALLAGLSARLTSQPQSWALVPAGLMAVVGLGLLLWAPGDDALTAAGWVWPPIVAALAVWMTAQMRRALRSPTRVWLLYPVVGFLGLAAVGGFAESVQLTRDHRSYAMPGRLYDVGGHRLHLHCTGRGSPTVVLENGLGETSPAWGWVAPAVSGTTRVCAYDRAGQGWSDGAPAPQDGRQVAADLHALLGAAHENGPYVLTGHSTGGAYLMTYAARYPAEVAGMVLLDSAGPEQFALPDFPMAYAVLRRLAGVAPSLGRLGLGQLAYARFGRSLPAPAGAQARAFATSPRDMRSQRDELSTYRAVFTQARALTSLGGKPLVVVTATGGQQQAGWSAAQDRLAGLSRNSSHRLVAATHGSLLADQQDAASSTRAITDVVRAVRTGAAVR
ncbi:MAG: alpha/beta hydrolase fold protein [Frankiales bacterium]|nr:alpha/beta hydrolase fold protein [Frankiales bacterium]